MVRILVKLFEWATYRAVNKNLIIGLKGGQLTAPPFTYFYKAITVYL